MRLCASLIGGGILVLGLSASTPAATRVVTVDPIITVTYAGTLDAFSEPFGDHPRGPDLHEAHYRWSLVWKGRSSELEQNASYRFETGALTGTIKYVDRVQLPAEKNRNDCTGTFSPKPGIKVPVVVTLNPDNRKGFGVQLTRPVSDTYLTSSNKKSNYDLCTRVFAGLLPSKSQIVSPFFYFPSTGGTRPNNVRHTQTLAPNERFRTTVDETVTVVVAGKRPPTTGPSPADANAKLVARGDLRRALERAKGPCLHLAISLGVITTGAVWSSIGAPIPGGIPAGGSLIATGAVMGQAVVQMCTEQIRQIIVSYSIYKRDPPVPKGVVELRLPSCTRWQAKVRAYCAELSAAVKELVSAERTVLPTLKRLQSAAAKLTAARARGDKQVMAKAQGDVNRSAASLEDARSTSSAAGKKVARLVTGAGIQGKLTRGQSAHVIDALLAELEKRGVPASDLREIAPGALGPGAIDVLAALSR